MSDALPTPAGLTPDESNRLKSLMHELEKGMLLRVQAVEEENRRLKRLGRGAVIVLGVLLGLAAALVVAWARRGVPGTVADVVQARSFIVRDADGRVRGTWGLAEDGSLKLMLQDARGKASATLALLHNGAPGFALADSSGRPRVVLGLLPDETISLVFADGSGRTRAVLGLTPDGASTLAFANRDGDTRAGLGVDARGLGTFTLLERLGSATARPSQPPEPADSQPGDSASVPRRPAH